MKNELTTAQDAALKRHTAALQKAAEALENAIDLWNETASEAHDFAEEIHERMQEHFDGKSEKWQESQNGRFWKQWMAPWEEAQDADVAVEMPDTVDTLVTAFDSLSNEAEVDE